VAGARKGDLENINGFLNLRLCHNVDRGFGVTAMCLHPNEPPEPHSGTMQWTPVDS
jgi:hypothetical protein